MPRTLKYLSLFASLVLLFSSCTKDEEVEQILREQGVQKSVSQQDDEANGNWSGLSEERESSGDFRSTEGDEGGDGITDDEDDEDDDDDNSSAKPSTK